MYYKEQMDESERFWDKNREKFRKEKQQLWYKDQVCILQK